MKHLAVHTGMKKCSTPNIPYMKNKEDVPTTRPKLKKKIQARLIDYFEDNLEKLKLDKNNVLVKEGMESIGLS